MPKPPPPSGPNADVETIIRDILLELGAPDRLLGHSMVVTGIMLAVNDWKYVKNITSDLYPTIAEKHGTTASRVERAIRHLIEVAWMRGDMDVLAKYFGNTVSTDKAKPTNGEFIARMANLVKQRLKNA